MSKEAMDLKIVSPEKILFEGETDIVGVPGSAGRFEILKGHAPIISSLEEGIVEYATPSGKQRIDIKGGFVEVKNDNVLLCVET